MNTSLKKWLRTLENSNPDIRTEAINAGLMGQRDRTDTVVQQFLERLQIYSEEFKTAAKSLEEQGLYQSVAEYLHLQGDCLDLGFGHGDILNHIRLQGTFVAVENNPYMFKSAQNRIRPNAYASATIQADPVFGIHLRPKAHGNIIIPGEVNLVLDDYRHLPETDGHLPVISSQNFTPDDVTLLLSGEAIYEGAAAPVRKHLLDATFNGAIQSAHNALRPGYFFHMMDRMLPTQDPLEIDPGIIHRTEQLFSLENMAYLGRFEDVPGTIYGLANSRSETTDPIFDLVVYTFSKK
jgi:SAM-dependent methyltransferase